MAKKNNCGDLFISIGNEIYDNTVFSRFFDKNDPIVMGWAENVLAKLTAEGILPTFLQKKDNEDFKAFWGTITHLFALAVVYSRKYKEIDSNKILFDTFVQNKGIITDLIDSQEQMEYLFYNYLTEYNKRGRLDIISKEGEILGELLRLIRYDSTDEFVFALLEPQDTGWVLGSSSPSWKRTNTIKNITKAYEFTEDVVDLEKYPLLRSSGVQIVNDRDSLNRPIRAMSFSGIQSVGIQGSREQTGKYIPIDPSISYEISLKVKINALEDQNLKFGVQGYNNTLNQIDFAVLDGVEYQSKSNWFHTNTFLNLPIEGVYYELKGLILAHNRRYSTSPILNFISGRALSMTPEMKWITPVFIQEREESTNPLVYVYDLKVKPLDLPFEQGYLGARDIIASYYKNNAFQKEATVNSFLKKYLLSYKNIFRGIEFAPLKEITLTFKVFSDRNQYLQGANISLNGINYQTNSNGEVTLLLYPGLYSYDVTAEGFESVLGSVLEIDNRSKVEYIQMQGTAFQRTVSFSVKSNNIPLSGAKISFADQVIFTGANGLAFIEVFPGVYEYIVELYDYKPVNRNIRIDDDTTIDIEMEAIPYFNVAFRVRDNTTPVSGAAVVLTGDFDGDETVTELTGSTNSLGIVSGFRMRAGTFQYRISRAEYITQSGDFSIVANATIEIALVPVPKYNITFIVKNNALAVSGALVTFNGKQLTTGSNGTVTFREPDGEYNYSITKTEFYTQSGAITVSGIDITKNINFIQIGYTAKFIVSSKGVPLSGVRISIGTETISTNSAGEAEFLRISGSYNWTATLAGYYQEQGVVLINGGSKTTLVSMTMITFNAIFTVRINGQVVGNQPVGCNGSTVNTDSQGIARFNLPPGSYGWSVTRALYDSQSGTVLLVDRDVSLNVDLAATKGTIVFTAKDSDSGTFLGNVAVSVNGETKYTASTGQVSFDLVLGNYNYSAALTKYNNNSGTFQIIEGISYKDILMVKEAAKIWSLTFTAKEGLTPLSGVTITLGSGQSGITNTSGQAVFSVISGTYDYNASYNSFFSNLSGRATVSEANTNVDLSFVRKTTQVTFVVKDSLSAAAVSGVSIEFNNTTKSTNVLGDVSFTGIPMSSNSLRYVASKNPPYKDLVGTTVVNTENPTVNLTMGQYTYDIIFTVKGSNGALFEGASVTCNGKSGTTNSSGQVTLSGYINGSYSYTVTRSDLQTVTGSISINNGTGYVNIVMQPTSRTMSFHVCYKDAIGVPGVTVAIGNQSLVTNSNGDVVFTLSSGTYNWTVGADSYYIPVSGSVTIGYSNEYAVPILDDVFTLKIATEVGFKFIAGITNTYDEGLSQIKIDWGDGVVTMGATEHTYSTAGTRLVKICPTADKGEIQWSYQYLGFFSEVLNAAAAIYGIMQWPQQVASIYFMEGAFYHCISLTSVGKIKGSRVSGTPKSFFEYCRVLKSVPAGFFDWHSMTPSLEKTFADSGLEGIVSQGLLAGITKQIVNADYAFANTKITGVEFSFGALFAQSSTANYIFSGCTNLTFCKAFSLSTYVNNIEGAFQFCEQLNTWPVLNINGYVTMRNCFEGCFRLPANPQPMYLPRLATDCDSLFRNCSSISSFSPYLFGAQVASYDFAFLGCTSLTDIANTKIPKDGNTYHVTSCVGTYQGCGVVTIPAYFFSGMSTVQSFSATFESCKKLDFIGTEAFAYCRPRTMYKCFKGCFVLRGARVDIFSWQYPLTSSQDFVARYCTNYQECFSGCSNLAQVPEIKLSDKMPTSTTYLYYAGGKTVQTNSGDIQLPTASGSGCFAGCIHLQGGLSAVPTNWK